MPRPSASVSTSRLPAARLCCWVALIALTIGFEFRQGAPHVADPTLPAMPAAAATMVQPQNAPVAGVAPLPVVITPGMRAPDNQAVARRGGGGHFFFDTTVNGVHVPMMFDTGASQVNLRAEDAARLGIDVSALRYSGSARTANGTADVAPTIIATLTVGTITRRNVPALVGRPGKLDVNLLGQSFLARVAGYRLDGDKLVLTGGD